MRILFCFGFAKNKGRNHDICLLCGKSAYCINQMCPLKEQCAPSHGSHGGEDYTTGLQGITFIKAKQMGDAEILEVQRLFQKLFVALVKGQLRSPEQ